jgi:hypothetical protein
VAWQGQSHPGVFDLRPIEAWLVQLPPVGRCGDERRHARIIATASKIGTYPVGS